MIEKLEKKKADIHDIVSRYNDWCAKQFPLSTPVSSLKGLKREVKECISDIEKFKLYDFSNDKTGEAFECLFNPTRIEYADCLMYIIDSARRIDISINSLLEPRILKAHSEISDIQYLYLVEYNADKLILEIENSNFESEVLRNFKVLFLYKNIFNLILDSGERFGLDVDDMFFALDEKLQININRDWAINEDKSYSHVK